MQLTNIESSSDVNCEYQMPSAPKTRGRVNTAMIENTRERRNVISAETRPLFRAVKNEDA